MSKLDDLYAELERDDDPVETTMETVEKPSEPVETVEKEPEQSEQVSEPEKPSEPVGNDEPASNAEPEKAEHQPIPDDRMKRAEFSFRRQLNKTKEKHERELKERDDKYEALRKEFEEFKKSHPVPEVKPKTREDFDDDEEFMHYLNKSDIAAEFAKRDAAEAKARQEREEAERKAAEEKAEFEKQQREWIEHVDRSFGGDRERADRFLDRMQYCNEQGFGEVLDKCPVAADFLMHNPDGIPVFEKIINDRDSMTRVFSNVNPLDIYFELREMAKELKSAPAATAPAVEQPRPMPHLGRPGKQAGTATAPDIWNDDKALKAWLKQH